MVKIQQFDKEYHLEFVSPDKTFSAQSSRIPSMEALGICFVFI